MKLFYALFISLLLCHFSNAQQSAIVDNARITEDNSLLSVDSPPEYPGGNGAFLKYISQNLKYPDIARLLGISGRLYVSFIIERDGRVTNVAPKSCIGAGCEAEATRLLETSPLWRPGIQNRKAVRVAYTVPIAFIADVDKVYLKKLRSSGYGFVFSLKDSLYTIDEVEKILGNSFPSKNIEIAEPFFNYNHIEKFEMPDKKEVYLLIFKST
jgi:protein TonB